MSGILLLIPCIEVITAIPTTAATTTTTTTTNNNNNNNRVPNKYLCGKVMEILNC